MIKFPKMHIAQSVVNRILNVRDGMPDTTPGLNITPAPELPDTLAQGQRLDLSLAQPNTAPLPGIEAAPEVATGKPLLNTLIEQ